MFSAIFLHMLNTVLAAFCVFRSPQIQNPKKLNRKNHSNCPALTRMMRSLNHQIQQSKPAESTQMQPLKASRKCDFTTIKDVKCKSLKPISHPTS